MARIILLFAMLFTCFSYTQVGIGTTTPKSSLDITVSDSANPANTDGLLIPRIDVFPVVNPTVDQQGMLVYLTTTVGTNFPGFYYWDNTSITWTGVVGGIFENSSNVVKVTSDVNEATADFIFGSTQLNHDGDSNHYNRFFFDKSKGAFRAGMVDNNLWDSSNIGMFSAAFGEYTLASGEGSMAWGGDSAASGTFSTAWGAGARAEGDYATAWGAATAYANFSTSWGGFNSTDGNYSTAWGLGVHADAAYETAFGVYNTVVSPNSATGWNAADRLLVIGNGTSGSARSNALTIYKNGTMNINDAYSMPITDGVSGQALTTDGAGNISWITPITTTVLQDTDTDTKIQVEESADDDIIRFDMAGTEYFRMNTGRLETVNTGGSVIIGKNAGLSDDLTGRNSVYVGTNAGKENVRGHSNVAVGLNAYASDTDGFDNVAIGTNALTASIGSGYNVAIGKEALSTLVSGTHNVAIGTEALKGNDGGANVAIGQWAGRNNTGYKNIFIGHGAGDSSGNVSNRLFIDMAPSSFPLIYGEFDNELLRINGTLDIKGAYQFPTVDGTAGQALTTDGSGNVTWATQNDTGAFEVLTGVVQSNTTVDNATDDFVFGSTQLDLSGSASLNKRFFFDKSKGAFRAGYTTLNYWDEANIGNYSFAVGEDAKASGTASVAWGKFTTASNTRSTAWGYGTNSTAESSTSWGYQTKATADIATAWGQASEATGSHATAWGIYTDATGTNSTSWGDNTLAASYSETVLGAYNTTYTPISSTTWNTSDRLFVIGNGTSTANRSNALTLKKNGDLGLGTDNPTAKLDIRPGDNAKGIYVNHDKTTTGTAYGAHIDVDHTAGTSNTIYGALIDATKTGATSNSVYGVYGRAYDIQTGTGTRYIYGLRGYSSVSSSNGTTNSRGVYGSTAGNGDNEYGGYFVGDVYSTGAYQTSDRKLKKNIHEYKGALEKLTQIEIKSYNFKTKEYQYLNLPDGKQIGVIAQDLEKVFPGMVKRADESVQLISREDARNSGVSYNEVGDKDMVEVGKDVEILAVNYTNLVPVLIQATKEQQTTIENQAAKIENLEARLQKIEQLLNKK